MIFLQGKVIPTLVSHLRKYSMAPFYPVSHVIFDLDGTILDTETIYTDAYRKVIESFGKTYDNKLRLAVTGTVENDTCRIMVETLKLPVTPEEFSKKSQEIQRITLATATLKPGAERLIRHLHNNNVPIAIATSSGIEKCKIKCANYTQLFSLFNHFVMGSSDPEVTNGKPAPDIFLITAKRFPKAPAPEECLVFEDAPNGVIGARAAGMQVVMIPEGYIPEEMTKDATLVINSLEEFKPEVFGLPPFPK